jgi:hypothetical protein
MTGEDMVQTRNQLSLQTGSGTIDPQARIEAGEITEEGLQRFVEAIESNDYYGDVDPEAIPCDCVDGRFTKDGAPRRGTAAAGGTFSIVMADALTNGSLRRVGENAAVHAKRIYGVLSKGRGKKIGVHDDDQATGFNCGCGAEDKLDNRDSQAPSILRFIAENGNDIRTVLQSAGVAVDPALNESIKARAVLLRQENYASAGVELRDAAVEVAGKSAVLTLTGPHNEVVLNINTRVGKTLDRQRLLTEFGPAYQAFSLDVASLKVGTDLISVSVDEDAPKKLIAALYYNVATASVLAAKSLRIIVG